MSTVRSAWLFPCVLAVVLGGVSFWLDRVSQVETEEIALDPNEPKYRIGGIHGERFDENGLIRERLRAETAWQLPENPTVHIGQPELHLFEGGILQYQVKAATAAYHTDTRQVTFDTDVVLQQTARNGQSEGWLRTQNLTVDTVTQTARTQSAVQYRYGLSHGSAVGFEYNRGQGFLNLSSRIKATIYDPR